MRAPKPRLYPTAGSNPPAQVPDAQMRALDRRQALDQQQRSFTGIDPRNPPIGRPRPPG